MIKESERMEMPGGFEITDKEREALEAYIETGSMTRAAEKLELPLKTVSARISRWRVRYHRAKGFIRESDRYVAKLPTILDWAR